MPKQMEHSTLMSRLGQAQSVDKDNRDRAREAKLFIGSRNGQWEQQWYDQCSGRPRYTYDMTTPIVKQIHGELARSSFDIKVHPAGGEASKDVAEVYDGLIRNIEALSGAKTIFSSAAKDMIISGIGGWRIIQKYVDSDSFDQDLVIEYMSNFDERVWFDPASENRDRSDARYAFVLTTMGKEDFEEKYPKRTPSQISTGHTRTAFWNKSEGVMVGEYYYYREVDRELVMMSNGAVYDSEELESVIDDLAAMGITESKRRKRKERIVYVQKFDENGWIDDEPRETVFKHIPLIPVYADFSIIESKVVYMGVIERLIDPQRVLNYSMSREVEEGALAPRAKYWMTEKQAAGHEDTLATMNTNSDPVQFFNPDMENPGPPQQNGGAQINPGLRTISTAMQEMIGMSGGMFAANMGDNQNAQSGIAIERLQNKGDNGTYHYFEAMEIAVGYTGKVLIGAIPKVYGDERQVRLMHEDGDHEMTTLNQRVIDNQTGQVVTLKNLNQGLYDVTCSSGPAFQNKQQEAISALLEMATVDPSIIELGGDVLLRNTSAPGMDVIAKRKRLQLINAGVIPDDQLNEEEMQMVTAMRQQPQQPDAATLLAQAEIGKAQAQADKVRVDAEAKGMDMQLRQQETEAKLMLDAQRAQSEISAEEFRQMMQLQQMQMEQVKSMAETLKTIREAMGADAIVSPQAVEAYGNQADELNRNI